MSHVMSHDSWFRRRELTGLLGTFECHTDAAFEILPFKRNFIDRNFPFESNWSAFTPTHL